jgi:hypothetical protein
MADKQAITEILNQAGVAYDIGDSAYLGAMFSDQSTFSMVIAGGDPIVFDGGEAIRKLFSDSMQDQSGEQRRHVVTNIHFTADAADSATAVSYLVLLVVADGKLNLTSSGQYTDDFVLEGGRWLIKKRHLELDLPY